MPYTLNFHVDSIGGYHEGGTGIDPDGKKCEKCKYGDCSKCPIWRRKNNKTTKSKINA